MRSIYRLSAEQATGIAQQAPPLDEKGKALLRSLRDTRRRVAAVTNDMTPQGTPKDEFGTELEALVKLLWGDDAAFSVFHGDTADAEEIARHRYDQATDDEAKAVAPTMMALSLEQRSAAKAWGEGRLSSEQFVMLSAEPNPRLRESMLAAAEKAPATFQEGPAYAARSAADEQLRRCGYQV